MRSIVTIAMPVYNGADHIRQALDSARAQTFSDFELIISDNASDDETQTICESYCRIDPRFKYLRQKENRGAVGNFSYLAEIAQGEYLTWLAHDDCLYPEYLEKTVAYLRSHPEAIVVSGEFECIGKSGNVESTVKLSELSSSIPWKSRRSRFFEYPSREVYLCIYGLIRRECAQSIMERFPFKESFEWDVRVMSLLAVQGEIASIPFVLRAIRNLPSSDSASMGARRAQLPLKRRIWDRLSSRMRTRRFQLETLMSCPLPVLTKGEILFHVLVGYVRFFVAEQMTLPKRALLVMAGKR